MNLSTIGIIIGREYANRVHKKSFLVTTFVVPVLMALLCIVPIVMMMNSSEKAKNIAVVDNSGIVLDRLHDTRTIIICPMTPDFNQDSLKQNMERYNFDAVLTISELDSATKSVGAEIVSVKPLGLEMTENLSAQINSAVEQYRVTTYGIPELRNIMDEVKSNIKLHSYTIDDSGNEKASEAGVYAGVSMALGLVIFLFITLFGGMVMSAVIEEKSSRVVEVLVSSVKATELMFGKIIGIALVALTQFLLWIILTFGLVTVAGSVIGLDKMAGDIAPASLVEQMGASGAVNMPLGGGSELGSVISTLMNLPVGRIIGWFLLFFIFGYMLYASLYAAIGSAVENEGDTQQLQLPVTIPLMLAYFIAIYAFNAPDSAIAVWGSMIPFTSPIVMLARLPFGVPDWQLWLSFAILVLTFVVSAWVSAKIYKVGILMFGKKSTFKDLWKWLKQD